MLSLIKFAAVLCSEHFYSSAVPSDQIKAPRG